MVQLSAIKARVSGHSPARISRLPTISSEDAEQPALPDNPT
jgi:hypothetical protein